MVESARRIWPVRVNEDSHDGSNNKRWTALKSGGKLVGKRQRTDKKAQSRNIAVIPVNAKKSACATLWQAMHRLANAS